MKTDKKAKGAFNKPKPKKYDNNSTSVMSTNGKKTSTIGTVKKPSSGKK